MISLYSTSGYSAENWETEDDLSHRIERIELDDEFRTYVDDFLKSFVENPSLGSQVLSGLSDVEQNYFMSKTIPLNLYTKVNSFSPGFQTLCISKSRFKSMDQRVHPHSMCNKNKEILNNYVKCEISMAANSIEDNRVHDSLGKLCLEPMKNVSKTQSPMWKERESLPIFNSKQKILKAIAKNSVVIVSAETGSGKTTQVSQYILEEAAEKRKPVKIVCTQPRRISTISVANRVAAERGEEIGNTVGYQIKLESRISAQTSLIYCTSGILLKTLMFGEEQFKNMSHIIVDEIHERDKNNDFLLICLRRALEKFPHLKIILMSATMDMDLYVNYFKKVEIVSVAGRSYPITSLFLDDILPMTRYTDLTIMNHLEKNDFVEYDWVPREQTAREFVDPDLDEEVVQTLSVCCNEGNPQSFDHMMQLIKCENIPVDYVGFHASLPTILTAACYHGRLDIVQTLLPLGASTHSTYYAKSVIEVARENGHIDVANYIEDYKRRFLERVPADEFFNLYEKLTFCQDYELDNELILSVINYIHTNYDRSGAILVFLPGYDDIMHCLNKLKTNKNYALFPLHSNIQMSEQKKIFRRVPQNQQKVILSTNIAETSITIDDVRYVVDCGKAKVKDFDLATQASCLQTQWISKASMKQRAGRAGRTQDGLCFHIYSKRCYESLEDNTIPEILRTPLQELCLQAKVLTSKEESVTCFLQEAIEPPSTDSINSAIMSLKFLGAMDAHENLTDLGKHLAKISLPAHLGKMLVYSCIFKCLEPILILVSVLVQKDPFVLGANNRTQRFNFGNNSSSDHFILIRLFQKWDEARSVGKHFAFCYENFISPSSMDTAKQTAKQLLNQLKSLGFVPPTAFSNNNELNFNSNCWPMVKGCIATGLYPKLAYYDDDRLKINAGERVKVHSSSINKGKDSANREKQRELWIGYEELTKNFRNNYGKNMIKCTTVFNALTVALLCGVDADFSDGVDEVCLDDKHVFIFMHVDLQKFRTNVDELIKKKICFPRTSFNNEEFNIVRNLGILLTNEDIECEVPMVKMGIQKQNKFPGNNFNSSPRNHQYRPRHGKK